MKRRARIGDPVREKPCDIDCNRSIQPEPVVPSEFVEAAFRDSLLVEVICERVHCVMYEYAITTVEFVAEDYEGRVLVRPVVRRGNRENAERFLELCRRNGRHLSVPTILIDGDVVFTDVPSPQELRSAIESRLAERESPD